MRVIGLDPGLRRTGWGVVDVSGNVLTHVAAGVVPCDAEEAMAARLARLYRGLERMIADYRPDEAAVEESFVNKNPSSTLKLGLARGAVLLAPALAGLPVSEYPANLVKKSVVGAGHAGKDQVKRMVRMLLPGCDAAEEDAADALAVAICHVHHAASRRRWAAAAVRAGATP